MRTSRSGSACVAPAKVPMIYGNRAQFELVPKPERGTSARMTASHRVLFTKT
jgi:hypothetical protein